MSSLKDNISAIANALPEQFMNSIKAAEPEVRSERTLQFKVGANPAEVNRVKVSKTSTGFIVRFYKIIEVECIGDVPAENLQATIGNVLNGADAQIDITSILGKAAE